MALTTYTFKDSAGNTKTVKVWDTGTSLVLPVIGWTMARIKSQANNNATVTKASAAVLGGWRLYNNNASARTFKFYNKTTTPAPASDTPAFTITVQGNSPSSETIPGGLDFPTGLSYAIVTGIAETDNTSVAVDDITGVFWYL